MALTICEGAGDESAGHWGVSIYVVANIEDQSEKTSLESWK